MSRTRSVLITICFWSVSLCSRIDLYNEKVWSLGVTIQLHCNNSARYLTAPNGTEAVCWMLPDFTMLYSDQGRFQVLNNKWTLKIVNVSNDDLGLYHCMLRSSDVEWLVLRLGLNVGGPYFEDLWNKYRLNTVSGFSASFSFLLIAVAICLVYHFRYRSGDDDLNDAPGASLSDELHGKDGTATVVGVVVKDAVYENWKKSKESPREGSSTSLSRYVADVYPGIMDQQCTTRL